MPRATPAREMKHGPIALIDQNMPIVTLATQSQVYEKVSSNVQEAKARGGYVIAIVSKGHSPMCPLKSADVDPVNQLDLDHVREVPDTSSSQDGVQAIRKRQRTEMFFYGTQEG